MLVDLHEGVTIVKEFVVIELCKDKDGKITPSVYSHETIEDAQESYYGKCRTGVKSQYITHTVILMNSTGGILEGPKVFRHDPPATTQQGE